MLITTRTKTLLQIFCELMLYFQVIFKNMKESDDNFPGKTVFITYLPSAGVDENSGEMMIRTQTKTLLQIFCELILYFPFIFKNMKEADNIFHFLSSLCRCGRERNSGEMMIRTQTATRLQIFCECIPYFQVIFKNMKEADNIFHFLSSLRRCGWERNSGGVAGGRVE